MSGGERAKVGGGAKGGLAIAVIDGLGGVLAGATALHLWGPLPNDLGLWLWTGCSLGIWRAAQTLEAVPVLRDADDRVALVVGVITAVVVTVLTARARREPGKAGEATHQPQAALSWPRLWPLHVVALPACPGLLSVIAWGAGLSPGGALLGVLVLLALATLLPRAGELRGPFARPAALPRGRRRLALSVAFGTISLLGVHHLYISGPGIEPALVADGPLADGLAAAVAALPSSPLRPLLADAVGVGLGVALALLLVTRGTPVVPRLSAGPAGWAPPLFVLALVAAGVGAPRWVLQVWTCPSSGKPITWITRDPGTFQLEIPASGQLWAIDRAGRQTRRFLLEDLSELAALDWAEVAGGAWPEETFTVGQGPVWTALVTPEIADGSLLWPSDPGNGSPAGTPVPLPGCFVASALWIPEATRWLLGCEYSPEVVLLSPNPAERLQRFSIPDAGSFEELVLDPKTGRALALPLWNGTDLLEIDVGEARIRRRVFVGDFHWGIAADPRRRSLWIPRFHEGRLLELDLDTLAVRRSVDVGWGVRPVLTLPARGWVLAAGTYSGELWAVDLDGRRPTQHLPVGGFVRDLVWDEVGRRIVFAGRCGIGLIDPGLWPGALARPPERGSR